MKTNFKSIAIMTLVFAASLVAASTAFAQKPQMLAKADHGSSLGDRAATRAQNGKALQGAISAANRKSYEIGKTLTCVIDYSSYMNEDDDVFKHVIVDLTYLIDDLEGQPEAQQLQMILKGIIRNTKDLSLLSGEIEAVSKSYFTRLDSEKKWYFNVGSSQRKLIAAVWSKDGSAVVKSLKEIQGVIRTAPQGTPQTILDAIKGLSKYGATAKFTEDDLTALVDDTKIITNVMYT